MNKFKAILKSSRFQQLLVVAVLQVLVVFNVIDGDKFNHLVDIVSGLFLASVGIGTIDKNVYEAKVDAAIAANSTDYMGTDTL